MKNLAIVTGVIGTAMVIGYVCHLVPSECGMFFGILVEIFSVFL